MQNNNGTTDSTTGHDDNDLTFAAQNQMNTEANANDTPSTETPVATEDGAEPVIGGSQSESDVTPNPEATATPRPEDIHPGKQVIMDMTCKRHQKIFLLKTVVGMKGSHIAKLMGTNPGHVGNVLKDYKDNPEKGVKAVELFNAASNPDPAATSSTPKEEATPGAENVQPESDVNNTPDPAEGDASGQ